MTDADVDGSHIRTLLLTFFFRQLPELIERGYIYIAQPPLYKVKKGKQEQYLKDDEAMEEYLLQGALEGAALYINEDAPPVSGQALEELVQRYRQVEKTISRLSRVYPAAVLNQLLYLPKLDQGALNSREQVEAWVARLAEALALHASSSSEYYECTVETDLERNLHLPKIRHVHHSVGTDYQLDLELFRSRDFQGIVTLGEELQSLLEDGAFLQRGERRFPLSDLGVGIHWLMDLSRRGNTIQRYKGLGEMNPDQLWETTMDPNARRMLQVSIDDAIAADQLFTTLMGDEVEPRRHFIESNALNVSNLDI